MSDPNESKCPFPHGTLKQVAGTGTSNKDWWPNRLNLGILRQHSTLSDPMDKDFNYAELIIIVMFNIQFNRRVTLR